MTELARVPFTLLVRAYCSLCDVMLERAQALAVAARRPLRVIDVDADPQLETEWGDAVPVLFDGAPAAAGELCRYHWDEARVAAALAR